MSNMSVGADYEQLGNVHTQFNNEAANVDQLVSRLTNLVNQTVGTAWQGQAANQFQNLWQTEYTPALNKLREALSQAAGEVNTRMQRLQEADQV